MLLNVDSRSSICVTDRDYFVRINMATKEKHEKQIILVKLLLSEAEETITTNNNTDLETLKVWEDEQKDCIVSFWKARNCCKQQLDKKGQQQEEEFQHELEIKKGLMRNN